MALSGSSYTNVGGGYRLRLDWSATQNVAGNYSTITTKLYWLSYSQYYYINASVAHTGYSYIAGDSSSFSADAHLSANETRLIYTKTKNVSHASDGTLNTTLSASWTIAVTLSGTYYGTISIPEFWITLNTIPRASVPTVSPTPVTMGNNLTCLGHRADSSFTHKWWYRVGSIPWTLMHSYGSLPYDNDYTWTVPLSIASQTPNSTSIVGEVSCETFNSSGTNIGYNNVGFTATVPSSVIPTVTSITATELNTSVNTIVGKFVQGLSNIQFRLNVYAGAYGSSVNAFNINYNGVDHTGADVWETGTLSISGSYTATGNVTDSRNRVSSNVTVETSILPYSAPNISTFTAQRCNSGGVLNDLGTYLKITRVGTATSLINSTEKNTVSAKVYYRIKGTTTWTEATDCYVAPSSSVATAVNNTPIVVGTGSTFPITNAFEIKMELIDKFNTTISQVVVPVGVTVMSWTDDGVGIGKVINSSSTNALEVLGNTLLEGTTTSTGDIKSGAVGGVQSTLSPSTLKLASEGVGVASSSWNGWYDQNGTRQGWVGKGSTSNADITLYNDTSGGIINLVTAGGTGAVMINNSTVVDSGSNANGWWIRYYNGTQICTINTTVNVSIDNVYIETWLWQNVWNWTFPVAFTNTPALSCSYFKWGTGASWGTVTSVSSTVGGLRGMDVYSRPSGTTAIGAIAIGRWK